METAKAALFGDFKDANDCLFLLLRCPTLPGRFFPEKARALGVRDPRGDGLLCLCLLSLFVPYMMAVSLSLPLTFHFASLSLLACLLFSVPFPFCLTPTAAP